MISVEIPGSLKESQRLKFIEMKLAALAAAESDSCANLANFVSFLYWTLGQVNWVGVYILKGESLVLGPFCGKPACSRIAMGKGVCGSCAVSGKPITVSDVQTFPGHIACDEDSRSEIVMPLYDGKRLIGLLDIDSPVKGRFQQKHEESFASVANLIAAQLSRFPD